MRIRWIVAKLRGLLNRICDIRSCAQHCIHEGADNALILLLVDDFIIAGGLNEFCTAGSRRGCRFAVLHIESLKDSAYIRALIDHKGLCWPIPVDMDPQKVF